MKNEKKRYHDSSSSLRFLMFLLKNDEIGGVRLREDNSGLIFAAILGVSNGPLSKKDLSSNDIGQ